MFFLSRRDKALKMLEYSMSQGFSLYPEKIKAVSKHLGIDVERVIFGEFD